MHFFPAVLSGEISNLAAAAAAAALTCENRNHNFLLALTTFLLFLLSMFDNGVTCKTLRNYEQKKMVWGVYCNPFWFMMFIVSLCSHIHHSHWGNIISLFLFFFFFRLDLRVWQKSDPDILGSCKPYVTSYVPKLTDRQTQHVPVLHCAVPFHICYWAELHPSAASPFAHLHCPSNVISQSVSPALHNVHSSRWCQSTS